MIQERPPDYPVVAGINPKPRSPKPEGSPNAEVRSDCCACSPAGLLTRPNPARLRVSVFGFPSALGFRASDFRASARLQRSPALALSVMACAAGRLERYSTPETRHECICTW